MPAYSTHCTELISCVHAQGSFCCTACRRTIPSTALRPVAPGTHPTILLRRVLLLQGRTQQHYRATSFCFKDAPEPRLPCVPTQISRYITASRTHLSLVCPASPRRSPVTALRPSALALYCTCVPSDKNDFKTFKSNPNTQIYRSDHAPKRS